MTNAAIKVEGLGKAYALGGRQRRTETFREMLMSSVAAPLRRIGSLKGDLERQQSFWALKDVGFEVARGEVIGVIGANGAGKSTLLKILSRITQPSLGRVEIRGRTACLLEVGTGFHPELTGRENIYLNGAVLGMSRSEVTRRFDEIVAFSEIEQFLDTPVKRYSSGMYMRLAFSVASHLEADVLFVDEVLAVGDARFQQRCLGRMRDVAQEGRTVLLVSHNMGAVRALCPRVLVFKQGGLICDGPPELAIPRYIEGELDASNTGRYAIAETQRQSMARCIASAELAVDGGMTAGGVAIGAPLVFDVRCLANKPVVGPVLGIGINNASGFRITTLHTDLSPLADNDMVVSGPFGFRCVARDLALSPGQYSVRVTLSSARGRIIEHDVDPAFQFTVVNSDFHNAAGRLAPGILCCAQDWSLSHEAAA